MSDIKIYRIKKGKAVQLESRSATLERKIQRLIEDNLETLLGVRFLGTEYSTGAKHGGRIDTLGIDENGCPVIIEYKRTLNENVMNQGLFYLDWLLDHKAEFKLLVMEQHGKEASAAIEWSSPRLLCIAGDFTRYDVHAVQQINRNIELIRYAHYGEELLMLDLVNATSTSDNNGASSRSKAAGKTGGKKTYKTVSQALYDASPALTELYEALSDHAMSLGDDVQVKTLKFYFAFKRLKNFACVEVMIKDEKLIVHLKGDTATTTFEPGFSRDTANIGTWGTGNIELTIRSMADLEKAKPFILQSYEDN